jgi:putative ABC transport system permease protein
MRTVLRRWRPSLRMARRDLRSHPLRTLVAIVLVAIPVAVAVVAATMTTTEDWLSDNSLRQRYGTADARLQVTDRERARVEIQSADGEVYPEPVRRSAERDPLSVDVPALLPDGSRATRVGWTSLALATGGTISAAIGELDAPITSGLFPDLASGRAPTAPDEVVLTRLVADVVADDGTLELGDGTSLRVVGVLEGDDTWDTNAVVPPGSRVADPAGGFDADQDGYPTYLVDLPDLPTADLMALQRDLAAVGVGAWFRDSVEHRGAWGTPRDVPEAVDPAAVAVGAVVIGLGLVEVVVVVGAVFAVGARSQARVLGLLLASGASAADVRRTLLAQGLVIGVAASVLGGLAAWAVLALGRGPLGAVTGVRYLEWSVPVAGVVTTLLLGVLSAVLAAAIPAWGVGRMTASQALDGHVAAGVRARRHRTRTPGLWLSGVGLVGLVLCGPWIASSFRADAGTESPVPVLLGGLCAIALLAGVGLLVPWLVALAGAVTARGWLPWRLAARDAARNRGRTVASVLAVGMVTTGTVFAGFAVTAQAATEPSSGSTAPTDVVEAYVDPRQGGDRASLDRLRTTLADLVGATSLDTWGYARRDGRDLVTRHGLMVRVVDDAYLVSAGVDEAARSAFAEGAAVVAQPGVARGDSVVVSSGRGRRAERSTLPAVEVRTDWGIFDAVWLSTATAERLGAKVVPSYSAWAQVDHDVTRADLDTLRLHGIEAFAEVPSADPDRRVYVAGALGALALTALVVGLVVALAASDSRGDAATLAAVGAPPRLRRAVAAGHALFVGGLGGGLGIALGALGGATLLQVIAVPGTPVPWAGLGVLLLGVPLTCAVVGWLVAPTRLALTRRAG